LAPPLPFVRTIITLLSSVCGGAKILLAAKTSLRPSLNLLVAVPAENHAVGKRIIVGVADVVGLPGTPPLLAPVPLQQRPVALGPVAVVGAGAFAGGVSPLPGLLHYLGAEGHLGLLPEPRYGGAEGNEEGPGDGQADRHRQVFDGEIERKAADVFPELEMAEPGGHDEQNPRHPQNPPYKKPDDYHATPPRFGRRLYRDYNIKSETIELISMASLPMAAERL